MGNPFFFFIDNLMGNLLHLISWSHGVGCIECPSLV